MIEQIISNLIVLLEKKIMYGPPKDIITHLDHRITLDGLRYKYCVDGNWTDWSDISSYSSNPNFNNKIINFLKKNIKKTPKNRYLEFSRNMFYYFPHSCLTKYPLSFYNNLLKSLRQSNLNCDIMDKCWYFILKS